MLEIINLKGLYRKNSSLVNLSLIAASVFLTMSLLRPNIFLTTANFRSMAFQFPEFGLLALAVALPMLTGGIDLSIVSTAVLSLILGVSALGATPLEGMASWKIFAVVFLVLILIAAIGALCGLINGLLISCIGISPILATLGTMQLYGGIAVVVTGGTTLYGFPDQFVLLGNGEILGIPVPLIIFSVCATGTGILLNRSPWGIKVYLIGGNAKAAHFSGLDNRRTLIKVYLLSGVLSALAGIIMAARTNSANPDYGSSYLLLAILIAVLGGVNPSGGFGKVSGIVLAILALQFASSGLNMLRFSGFAKELVWGGLLILVMVLNRSGHLLEGLRTSKSREEHTRK